MNKGLDLIQRQQIEEIDGYPTGNVYVGLTLEELEELEKELKALEIIKKDPQRALLISNYKDYNEYINDKNLYWVEKELMEKDEFDLLKEVMK